MNPSYGFNLMAKLGIEIKNWKNELLFVDPVDLQRALEKATVVYSDGKNIFWAAQTGPDKCDTHKALLINVEELPKEPCKHEPKRWVHPKSGLPNETYEFVCFHCGVKLKSEKWVEEIKE